MLDALNKLSLPLKYAVVCAVLAAAVAGIVSLVGIAPFWDSLPGAVVGGALGGLLGGLIRSWTGKTS